MLSHRQRIAWGACLAIGGGIIAAKSGVDLSPIAKAPLQTAGAATMLFAGALLLLIAIPPGARATPVLLAAIGAVLWAAGSGWLKESQEWWFLGGLLALLIGGLALSRISVAQKPDVDPVHCVTARLLPKRTHLAGVDAPAALVVKCLGTSLAIDLSQTLTGTQAPMEMSITTLGGRVEVQVPANWWLVPGRLLGTESMRLEGSFDSKVPIAYLGSNEREAVRKDAADYSAEHPLDPRLWSVVMNVDGAWSSVAILRK